MKGESLRKRIVLILVVLLIFSSVRTIYGKIRTEMKEKTDLIELTLDAGALKKTIDRYLESRGDNILLHIQFVPDDTAFVYAEIDQRYIEDLFSLPDWFVFSLPEKISMELQVRPSLNQAGNIQLKNMSLRINDTVMPEAIGETVCAGLSYKINELLEKEGLCFRKIEIDGDMLKIETEKSSGR